MASQAEKEFITGKPVRIPKALREALDAAIQAHLEAVDKLTAVLDKADGDPDREPSLGALHGWSAGDQRDWAYSDDRDLEVDVIDEPHDKTDEGDYEPALGWVGGMNQDIALRESASTIYLPGTGKTVWVDRTGDLEVECEDEGAQCDDEGHREGI